MFAGEGMAGKLVPFKSEIGRGQGQHVPVGVKSKTGKFGESWLMRDVEAEQKKKRHTSVLGIWDQANPSTSPRSVGDIRQSEMQKEKMKWCEEARKMKT